MAFISFKIPFTGSSMNPARSFGPAAVGQFWENHWVCYNYQIDYYLVYQHFRVHWGGPSIRIILAVHPFTTFSVTFQVYWVGPILGGMCAGMLYQMAFRGTKPEPYLSVAN